MLISQVYALSLSLKQRPQGYIMIFSYQISKKKKKSDLQLSKKENYMPEW